MSNPFTEEKSQQKLDQQHQLIRQLTEENEMLFQQFNHLMIRNHKLLTRIDDQQKIIADLHIRLEELLLINSNQLRINDRLKTSDALVPNERMDFDLLVDRWKSYPGQTAQNTPTLTKQAMILALLYQHGAMTASSLFSACGIGGVTGARYVALLKKAGLICYRGARKKGSYELTPSGMRFVSASPPAPLAQAAVSMELPEGIPLRSGVEVTRPVEED